MGSRKQILIDHYSRLLRKGTAWAGLLALLGTMFVSAPASALGAQMGARSATVTTLKAGATASYVINFTPSSTNSGTAIKSIQVEICDSPLESVSCAGTGSSSGADASSATLSATLSGTGCTGGG